MSADQRRYQHRTKYKRLVNNIYPRNAADGLQRNEMTKLCFYVITEPQKLDRVFDYISKKTQQFVRRRRDRKFVELSLKAMDELMTVSSNQMTLFVNVYLKTLQKLLECGAEESGDVELLELSLKSFEHFCAIREETVNYQRSYNAFVECFGNLAHRSAKPGESGDVEKLHTIGLRGLGAIIRKLGNDDNQSVLWGIMPKVIPSLIFNMQDQEEQCKEMAEIITQDLFSRIQGNLHLTNCLHPLFTHLDNHSLWINQVFCQHLFDLIIDSVSSTTAHAVLTFLLAHVEHHLSNVGLRRDVLNIARYCLIRSRSDFLGSHIYTCLRQLMLYLKVSEDDLIFERAALDTIVDLAVCSSQQSSAIQTMESVIFILNEVPIDPNDDAQMRLQLILLQTVVKILSLSVMKADFLLPSLSLFDPLISLLQVDSAEARLRSAQILTAIFDRSKNASKLQSCLPFNVTADEITQPKKNLSIRITDAEFISRFGNQFTRAVQVSLEMPNNTQENVDALLILCVLFFKEYCHESSVLGRVVRMCLDIQQSCLQRGETHPFPHAFVAALLQAVTCILGDATLSTYVNSVINLRKQQCPSLLSLQIDAVGAPTAIPALLLFDSAQLPADYQEQRKFTLSGEDLSVSAEVTSPSNPEGNRNNVQQKCVTVEQLKDAFYGSSPFPWQDSNRSDDSSAVLDKWVNAFDMNALKKELRANRKSAEEKNRILDEIMNKGANGARSKRLLSRVFAF